MKKLIKTILATLLLTFSLGSVASAQSQDNCTISNTGTGSVNTCTSSETTTITVTCTNGVQSSFNNSQAATSGNATANGNTIVGTVDSGDTDNSASFANELALHCAAAPAATTPPATSGGGAGAGPQVAAAATTAKPAALPKTGPAELLTTVGISAGALTAAAAATQVGIRSYRTRALK